MGVDYEAVGGIGIKITDEMLKKLDCELDERAYRDGRIYEILDKVGVTFAEYGDTYCKRGSYVWIVPGRTYKEVVNNIPDFLGKLNKNGFSFTEDDLVVLSELFVY